jgi:chitodextrinase
MQARPRTWLALTTALLTILTFGFGSAAAGEPARTPGPAKPAPEMGAMATGLTATPMISAQDLVQQMLGAGVSVSNVTYTGPAVAAGTFTGDPAILGFGDGILLTSGSVQNVAGPNVSDSITLDNGGNGDANLDALIPGYTTYDATMLEFDFVPTNNVISFQYVFGSDEYNEWVGSPYNDVFGFFVNGVNVADNIARIPGTTTAVSVNNVNLNSYAPYYQNNEIASGAPVNTELDGLTTVISAQATVVANQTNHIKLAIADAGDHILDSAVFIKTGSFVPQPADSDDDGHDDWNDNCPYIYNPDQNPDACADDTAPVWDDGWVNATQICDTCVTLEWGGGETTGGIVQYRIIETEEGLDVATTSGTTYTYRGLKPNHKYEFKIEAGDAFGNWSHDGPEITVHTTAADMTPPTWDPGSGLYAWDVTETGLSLNWDESVSDDCLVAEYRLFQNGVQIAKLPAGTAWYDISGLIAGTAYTFKVEAVDQAGNISTTGPALQVSTPGGICTEPPALSWATAFAVPAGGVLDIAFRWDACGQPVTDTSVAVRVRNGATNALITGYTYGGGIAQAEDGSYHQAFSTATYKVTPGTSLKLMVYFGGKLKGTATVLVTP